MMHLPNIACTMRFSTDIQRMEPNFPVAGLFHYKKRPTISKRSMQILGTRATRRDLRLPTINSIESAGGGIMVG